MLLALLTAGALLTGDTLPFADAATEAVVRRAMARHAASDEGLHDYQARFRYRLSFGLGRRRWAEVPNVAAEEQEGTVHWSTPNDLRVEILGRRSAARSANLRLSSSFDRPWFVPRALRDSLRVFGNEIPPRAAIHPLSAGGPEWYRYRLTDSVQVRSPEGRPIKLLAVEVLPRRQGLSLVAGRLWLEAEQGDLVRLSFRFVGTELWLDPDDADDADDRWASKLVSRVLTLDADLEYALQDERHWLPYRQVVAGRVELPWFGELVVPFEARTTFLDYEVNTGRAVVFRLPPPEDSLPPDSARMARQARRDSLRAEGKRRRGSGGELPEDQLARDDRGRWEDGRYELHRAPGDSLAAYGAWGDTLVVSDDRVDDREVRAIQSDLERLAVDLPPELTGRPRAGFTWLRAAELLRYNRVQGLAPGVGYQVQLPGDRFTTLRAEGRFGLGDQRVTGGLTLVREAPGARWTLAGWRDLRSNDPFARAHALGNSLNAMFAAHDDADYHLGHGVRLTREGSLGTGVELTTTLLLEHERSARRDAGSPVNDVLGGSGDFPVNPPVREGTFGGAALRLDGGMYRTRWHLGGDVLGNDARTTGRVYGMLSRQLLAWRASPVLQLRAGVATAAPLPQQAFRLGGSGTVRGFDYGTRRGQAFWAAQLDVPLKRGVVRPVLFLDAGQAGQARGLFETRVLTGGGLGLALLGDLFRVDLSHPISRGGDGLRVDLTARGLF